MISTNFSEPIELMAGDILEITSYDHCKVFIKVFHYSGGADLATWEKNANEELDEEILDYLDVMANKNIVVNKLKKADQQKKSDSLKKFDYLLKD